MKKIAGNTIVALNCYPKNGLIRNPDFTFRKSQIIWPQAILMFSASLLTGCIEY